MELLALAEKLQDNPTPEPPKTEILERIIEEPQRIENQEEYEQKPMIKQAKAANKEKETQKKTKRVRKTKEIFVSKEFLEKGNLSVLQEECPVPAKRGRPSKAKSVESSTSETEPLSSPAELDIDPNKNHCFCDKPYDAKK